MSKNASKSHVAQDEVVLPDTPVPLQREWSWRWGGLPVQDPETWDQLRAQMPVDNNMSVNEKVDSYLAGLPAKAHQSYPEAHDSATSESTQAIRQTPVDALGADLLEGGLLVKEQQSTHTKPQKDDSSIAMSLCGYPDILKSTKSQEVCLYLQIDPYVGHKRSF